WKTMPIRSRRRRARASSSMAVTGWEPRCTLPAVARSSPASTISRLVLPEPDGPTSPTASPWLMSRSIPCRMLTGPAAEGTVRCRSLIRTNGARESRGTKDGAVASMAAAYGLRAAWKKAARTKIVGSALPAVAATPRLLILGDSLSAGYGLPHADSFEVRLQAALRAKGKTVTVVDGAVSGDTSAGGLARLDWTIGDGVDAAIVELGANDGLRG